MALTRLGFAITLVVVASAAIALAPVAAAAVPGCLPLNGTQLIASSHEDTNRFGIIFDTRVTYWYQNGAVNWRKTVDGGSFNLTHTNTTGTVPATPGGTVTIPGTSTGTQLLVTVCQ